MVKAGFLSRKIGLKLAKRRKFRSHASCIRLAFTWRKGIITEAIKAAHRRKVREHHPDRGGDKARFQAIQLAYDTLKDDERRKRYDETGETAAATNDPAIAMLGALIENLIGQMLEEGTPIETADMRQVVLDAAKSKLREIAAEKAKAERTIARAAKLGKRWKRKAEAEGPDLIGDSIRRRERDMTEALKRIGDAEKAWKRALKLIDGYTYEFDKRDSEIVGAMQFMRFPGGSATTTWTA